MAESRSINTPVLVSPHSREPLETDDFQYLLRMKNRQSIYDSSFSDEEDILTICIPVRIEHKKLVMLKLINK